MRDWLLKNRVNVLGGVMLLGLLVYSLVLSHMLKGKTTVVITNQDIVRWCLDRRAEGAEQKNIDYYCKDMYGDYYIAQGIKPNYDKYKSWDMFKHSRIKHEPIARSWAELNDAGETVDCKDEQHQVNLRFNDKGLITDCHTIRQSIEERMQHVTGKK